MAYITHLFTIQHVLTIGRKFKYAGFVFCSTKKSGLKQYK